MEYYKTIGAPLTGRNLQKYQEFLLHEDIRYDHGIEYSIYFADDHDHILAAGSIEKNVLKCLAVRSDMQGKGLMCDLISELVQHSYACGRTHLFIYTKPEYLNLFSSLGFYAIADTDTILFMENKRNGFREYLNQLINESMVLRKDKEQKIGAIVANCNPFTFGHRYLIEEALNYCDCLHIFVLSDKRSMFSAQSRYQMVLLATKELEHVCIHKGGEFVVSAATFPTYFHRDEHQAFYANCELDAVLFAKYIAPALGINFRIVGTEPYCKVTSQYNQVLKKVLTKENITVIEVNRKEIKGQTVSASLVRKYLKENEINLVKDLVPETTLEVILKTDYGMNR